MASYPIYQFYSELCDYEPKIWRRFQVPGNITLSQFGYILMAIFLALPCPAGIILYYIGKH